MERDIQNLQTIAELWGITDGILYEYATSSGWRLESIYADEIVVEDRAF